MRQSELTYCANRAAVLKGMIKGAKHLVNSQQPERIERAIEVAEDIVERLRSQLPEDGTRPTPPPRRGEP